MVGSLVFLAIGIVENYHQIPHIEPGAAVFGAVLFTVTMAILVNVIGALAWRRLVTITPADADALTNDLTEHENGAGAIRPIGFRIALRIWFISNIAKYIPGNLFQYAGRFVLARRSGIRGETAIVSMGLEAFLLCLSAGFLILFGLATGSLGSTVITEIVGEYSSITYAALSSIVILALLLSAYLFPKIRHEIRRRFSAAGVFGYFYAFFGYTLTFIFVGWSALVLLENLWRFDGAIGWYELSCGYALAFLLGYVVPGAPGGIGVREVVLVALFHAALGAGLVLGLAFVLRMASVVADLICFAVAVAIRENGS